MAKRKNVFSKVKAVKDASPGKHRHAEVHARHSRCEDQGGSARREAQEADGENCWKKSRKQRTGGRCPAAMADGPSTKSGLRAIRETRSSGTLTAGSVQAQRG